MNLKKLLQKKRNNKGFTLAELLIVIAIIAVLIAIAIPTFTGQLEKSREATDAANIRAKASELMVDYLNDGTEKTGNVTLQQKVDGWATTPTMTGITLTGNPTNGGSAEVKITANGKVEVTCS